MELAGKRVAVLVADLFEDLELYYPLYRLKEAGAEVKVLGIGSQTYRGKKGLSVEQDDSVDDQDPKFFDAVVIPGGFAPDRMRRHRPLLDFVRLMDKAGKPVAFICHAGWVPVSAGIVEGRKVTSYGSIRDDMVNAGAEWVDQEVVRDGNLISSRVPPDLPAFCRTLIAAMTE